MTIKQIISDEEYVKMMGQLEKKANSLMQFEFIEGNHRIKITYQGNLELLKQGIYEIFIGLYDSLRK